MAAGKGTEHVYKIVEMVGSSDQSIEEAIQSAVTEAAKSFDTLRWFETTQVRGHIVNGRVAHYQVSLKIGLTLDPTA